MRCLVNIRQLFCYLIPKQRSFSEFREILFSKWRVNLINWSIVLLIEVSVLFTRNCDISRTLWRGLMHKTTNGFRNKCSKPADVERIACLSSYSHLLFIDFDFPFPYFLKLGIKKFTHGTEKLFRLSGQKILRPGSNFESCLVCVFVIGLIIFIYLFVPVLSTNHSWEWGWQNSGWGFCQHKNENILQLIPLPLPLLYLSHLIHVY